ncbi:copper chaperone PCu(A)C [Ottowia thiooxydans]|uniref:Copper(I)-binding protein n=1 Tax=Ottowia thiooxydans TaxID=219182 RepID=A0ABV2Q2K6_9BURK
MSTHPMTRRAALAAATMLLVTLNSGAHAHDFRAGDVVIDHPYATPSLPGVKNGAAYFRAIRNAGGAADRLLGARTDVAARVELHSMRTENDVMRMREVQGIELPAGKSVQLRHGQKQHLMLVDLKKPLVVGDRFDLTLVFEKAGEKTVKVWVQQPREANSGHHQH